MGPDEDGSPASAARWTASPGHRNYTARLLGIDRLER